MQDSSCDSDIDCTYRTLKVEIFFLIFFSFSNFGMFFEHFRIQFRDIFFFEVFQFLFFKLKIKNTIFINETALRAPPAVTRLTVHRRLRVIPGRMPFGLICRLRNLLPRNRNEAISWNLTITID